MEIKVIAAQRYRRAAVNVVVGSIPNRKNIYFNIFISSLAGNEAKRDVVIHATRREFCGQWGTEMSD